jgi:O-antigen ligase
VSTGAGYFYDTPNRGQSTGVFANRNSHADLVQIAMLLLAAFAGERVRTRAQRMGVVGGLLLLALLCVISISRLGIAILPFTFLVSVALLFRGERQSRRWRILLPAGAALVIVALLIAQSDAIRPIFARFGTVSAEGRGDIWAGTLVAIRETWPWGTGLGTFVPVYAAIEDLDTMSPNWVNNAHNDYLELALDGGLAAVLLLIGFFAALGARALAVMRGGQPVAQAALAGVAVLLVHSVGDYPLRTFTLLAVFATLLAMLHDAPAVDEFNV